MAPRRSCPAGSASPHPATPASAPAPIHPRACSSESTGTARCNRGIKPSIVFEQHRETIRRLVAEHGMSNPRLFGSALHGDDTDTSDLDILVDPGPESSIFDVARLQLAIEAKLGIKIDLLTPNGLPPKIKNAVLLEAAAV